MASSPSLLSPIPVPSPDDWQGWKTADAALDRSSHRGLSFYLALLFLAVYYIRPQDWVPGMAGVNIVRPIMLVWFVAVFVQGSRSPIQGWFRTPHDWVMLSFFIYVAWTSPPIAGATSGMFSLVVFFYLTTQALSSWDHILGYLKAWNLFLICIAILGSLQTLGLDITGGQSKTDFFVGRLSLGTWLTNNPNALAHTIVPAIPLSYLLYFWRGSAIGRFIIFPACLGLVGYCTWLTASRGAFLVGAGVTAMLFIVGRPKWVQILVIALVLSLGVGALSFLPRMEQMGDLRSDEGVLGRLMAWEMARTAMDQNTFGVGWKQFIALIDWKEGAKWIYDIPKATHSSYVQVGADLGRSGLFIWILGLWTALRTTLFFKSQSESEERCRRAALLLLIAYLTSGWMVNRQYHTEYFLMVAVAAAIHRLAVARTSMITPPSPAEVPSTSPYSPPALNSTPRFWKRLGWLDLAATAAITWCVLALWDYILKNL